VTIQRTVGETYVNGSGRSTTKRHALNRAGSICLCRSFAKPLAFKWLHVLAEAEQILRDPLRRLGQRGDQTHKRLCSVLTSLCWRRHN
jgi:hypothetical protein